MRQVLTGLFEKQKKKRKREREGGGEQGKKKEKSLNPITDFTEIESINK